jgi:hypothetical protein
MSKDSRPEWWPENDWPPQLTQEQAEKHSELVCDHCGEVCNGDFLFITVFNGEKYFCSQECSDSCLDDDKRT